MECETAMLCDGKIKSLTGWWGKTNHTKYIVYIEDFLPLCEDK